MATSAATAPNSASQQHPHLATPLSTPSAGPSQSAPLVCAEIAWRQMRWPATEAGQLAVVACPAHATYAPDVHLGLQQQQPSGGGATLACQPNGQWASRIQAGRCQSIWLRNLTQRLEAGDSPLSVLNELVQRTLAQVSGPTPGGGSPNWPYGFLAEQSTLAAASSSHQQQRPHLAALFGSDLVQIGRIVSRLVDEMSELLNGISDDKQRISFAREMIQVSLSLSLSRHLLSFFTDYIDLKQAFRRLSALEPALLGRPNCITSQLSQAS